MGKLLPSFAKSDIRYKPLGKTVLLKLLKKVVELRLQLAFYPANDKEK